MNATFVDCNLKNAIFDRSTMNNARFIRSTLELASLVATTLNYADFGETIVLNTDFTQASLIKANFLEAEVVQGSIFFDSDLLGAHLTPEQFRGQRITTMSHNLRHARLPNGTFRPIDAAKNLIQNGDAENSVRNR